LRPAMPCSKHRTTLDRQILRIVRADPVCRLLMTAPGVGALVSLAFKADPARRGGAEGFTSRPAGESQSHGTLVP
jgi:transposase